MCHPHRAAVAATLATAFVILAVAVAIAPSAPARAAPDTKPAAAAAAPPKKPPARKAKDHVAGADRRRDERNLYKFNSIAYAITTDVDKDLANDIAAHMDAVCREYELRFTEFKPNPHAAVPPKEPMPLYVLQRYTDYVRFLAGFGVNGENSGGVFFRTADKRSGLATWVEGQSRLRMYDVLQHEGFHQFADARIMTGLPPWVNEGIAEYFGEAVLVDNRLLTGRLDRGRLERMRNAVKEGATLPFAELMTMGNEAWVRRVNAGNKSASLMYDTAWSVCYYLIHGGKRNGPLVTRIRGERGPALEGYLRLLNQEFVRDPRDPTKLASLAFKEVFSNNLKAFERAWKEGLEKLEPDPWFSSVRHAQFIGAGLKLLHGKRVEVNDWADAKEKLGAIKFRMVPRERDAAGKGDGKPRMEEVQTGYDFPAPAEAALVPSEDPKLPPGLRVTNVTPNIVLGWELDAAGEAEEDIQFVDPPRQAKKPASAVAKPPNARPTSRP